MRPLPSHIVLRRLPLLLLLLPACEVPAAAPSAPPSRPPPPVSVAEAGPPLLDRSFPVLGEVRTRHRAELAVGVDGPVVKLDALEGQRVQRGALLVQVDDAVARAELRAARAAVDEARAALDRAEAESARFEQVSQDVVAGAELDRVRADVASLAARLASTEALVAQVQARIDRHAVRAPFAGSVVRRHVDPGDWVTPGRVLVELASTDQLDVLVDVHSAVAASLSEGQRATLVAGEERWSAVVAARVPVLDPATRTARIRLQPEAGAELLPGAPVTVLFETSASAERGARVPRDAVLMRPGGPTVVRLDGETAQPTTVQVLAEAPEAMLVQGVEPGDRIVIRGNESLRPGQAVRVVEGP